MAKKGKHRKKKKSGNKIALILLFISTFLITLFVISGILSTYSPPVDVNIGDGEFIENTAMVDEAEDYEDLEHADVDSRLKWIQYEDNMTSEEIEEEKQVKKRQRKVRQERLYQNQMLIIWQIVTLLQHLLYRQLKRLNTKQPQGCTLDTTRL